MSDKPTNPAPIIVNNGATWWQIAAVLGVFTSVFGWYVWQDSRNIVPPMPVPVPVVQIDEARSYVTRNGVTLADADAKAIIAAVKIGDGSYSLVSYPIGEKPVTKAVLIGDVKPDVVPVPPKPIDPPKPPDPPKPVDPPPIPVAGFRVLIVEETQDRAKLPVSQLSILTATGPGSVRDFLTRKCAKDSDGKTAAFKVLDKDQDGALLEPIWADAMKIKRDSVPWIIVSNGITGYSGELPKTEAETLELLGRYSQ